MPLVKPTVWTVRRKWLGNLIPALFWLPLTVIGIVLMVRSGEIVGLGLGVLIAATVVAWLAVNFFGLFENAKMKRQVRHILEAKGERPAQAVFVGVATPKYSSAIDPHEDVGYLFFEPHMLAFRGESNTMEMYRNQVVKVRYRWNVHTLIGLGRWISVEGLSEGKPIRLLIEPREKATLLGNLLYSKKLRQRIKRWVAEGA